MLKSKLISASKGGEMLLQFYWNHVLLKSRMCSSIWSAWILSAGPRFQTNTVIWIKWWGTSRVAPVMTTTDWNGQYPESDMVKSIFIMMYIISYSRHCVCMIETNKCTFTRYYVCILFNHWSLEDSGLILGLHPANERVSLQSNAVYHWLGANLESALRFDELHKQVSSQFWWMLAEVHFCENATGPRW